MPIYFTHNDIHKVKADVIIRKYDNMPKGTVKLKKGSLFERDRIFIASNSRISEALELAKKHKYHSTALDIFDSNDVSLNIEVNSTVRDCRKFLENNEMDITLVLPKNYTLDIWDDLKAYFSNMFIENPLKNMDLNIVRQNNFEALHGFDRHAVGNPAIEKLFKEMDISFSERLLMMIDERGLKDSEVYNAANISKQVFHKIRSSKKYRPKKITVLALAVGLKLSLEETDELLRYAGYTFARNDKTDIIVSFFIKEGNYNIFEINDALLDYDLQLLGSK